MPWQEQSVMQLRQEFVTVAATAQVSFAELCRRYRISPKTGYKWLARAAAGAADLADHSRRPQTSPRRTSPEVEARSVELRPSHPAWGGRKLHHRLRQQGMTAVPAPSTITDILHRHGLIARDSSAPRRWQWFEQETANARWQLDCMGHRPLTSGSRVHPLTIADDHARFARGLFACPHERLPLVQAHLTTCFQRYGLPAASLTDNGPPWGPRGRGGLTALEAWLLRRGIESWHGRVYHPQPQGKVERLHGTLAAEVFAFHPLPDLATCQTPFERFRHTYNQERPHQSCAYAVPASRYQPRPRAFPDRLPDLVYGPEDQVRRVRSQGAISFHDRTWFVSRGLIGLEVAVRPTGTDGFFQVSSWQRAVATIALHHPDEV